MADVLVITRYACPHCASEFPTREEAEACERLPVPVPKLRAGNVVRNPGIDDEHSLPILTWRVGLCYGKHVVQWAIDGTWFHQGEPVPGYSEFGVEEDHLYVVAQTPACADCEHGIKQHGRACYVKGCKCAGWRAKT